MSDTSTSRPLSSVWWLPLIKGVVAVVVGIIAMAMPRATITALVVVLGVYVLVDAVISVANGAAMRGVAGSRLMVVWGVLGGIIAIIMLAHPQAVMNLIVVLVGAWALVSGIFIIAIAVLLIPITERAWIWGLVSGAVAFIAGIAVLVHPGFGAVAMSWILGLAVLAYGVSHIGLGVGIRKVSSQVSSSLNAARADRPDHTIVEGEVVNEPGDKQQRNEGPQITG